MELQNTLASSGGIARSPSFTVSGHTTDREYRLYDDGASSYEGGVSHQEIMQQYDLDLLTKAQLLVLMRFSNAIMSQSLPVKCILMTLKALKANLSAEMVEICYPDKESTDWIIHSVGKDGILHKKTMPSASKGLYCHAFNTGQFLRIEDCEGHVMYSRQFDKHTDIEPQNLLIFPLIDSNKSVWGVAGIANCPHTGKFSDSSSTENFTPQAPFYAARADRRPSEATPVPSRSSSTISYSEGSSVTTQKDVSHIDVVTRRMDKNAYKESSIEDQETTPSLHEYKHVWEGSTLALALQICDIGGRCISNAIGWRQLDATREKANGLLTLMHSLFADRLGIQSCVVALTTHARKLIQAERCTVYIVDHTHDQLWSISSDDGSQVIVSLRNGCASQCVSTGESIVIDNTFEDDRYVPEFDSRSGVQIRNVAWVPIKSGDCNRVLAVIEVINKQTEELLHFGEDDLRLLEIFSAVVGPQLEKSDFAASVSRPAETEAGLAFKTMPQTIASTTRQHIPEPCIPETEEE